MKLRLLVFAMLFCIPIAYAQVGIGTTLPQSSLDIAVENAATPSSKDGVLIPRIEAFPVTNPGANQNGMLVFLNTATAAGSPFGANPIGFYYWSNPLTKWVGLTTGQTGWSLTGNAGTVDGTNFLGTTDDKPLNFRVNNQKAGRISTTQTFYGYQAGNTNAGNNNVAFGAQALFKSTNSNSTAVGYQALYSSVTGGQNTAVGFQSLMNGTSDNNTAVGYRSLRNTTTGNSNTAVGRDAMLNTTEGKENVAVGKDALLNNTTGNENVAVGREAMLSNTTGGQNTALGKNALAANTTSVQNTAVGKNAMNLNTTGEKNTGIGSEALNNNTTGNYNTAVGFAAMYLGNAGNRNTALGYEALRDTNSEGNVAVGFNAMRGNKTGNYNVAVGYEPLFRNTTGLENIALGHNALNTNTSGGYNIAVGTNALNNNTTGTNNIALGNDADVDATDLTNAIAIGAGARVNASNKIKLGNAAITVLEAQVALTTTSDRRYKEAIETIPLGLDFINQLRPVEYIRKNNTEGSKEWGIIAQELQETLKELNYANAGIISDDRSADHYLSVRYTDFIAPIIKAIQELSEKDKEIEILKAQLQTREDDYKDLLLRVEALEQAD